MKKKLLALLLACVMVLGLAACGGSKTEQPSSTGDSTAAEEPAAAESTLHLGYDPNTDEEFYGPYYDEWSDMTDEELYEQALKEDTAINVYATSSKMLKAEEPFEEMYPGLDLIVSDLDSDEVLSKAQIEHETGNVTADVLQTKDVNGSVFYEWYNQGILEPFYPRDICAHIDEGNLKYSYPLYASQAFWYYNTEAFPDGQPIDNWWQIIEKDENGKQRFRLFTKEQLQKVTKDDALRHPTWDMGAKITIDSATMMNKGFEVIEAKWLFGVDADKIQVLVHPQSIVHSAVQFADGAVKAQLGVPDMRLPIQYAFSYPNRLHLTGDRLDLFKHPLEFFEPDLDKFRCLALSFEAIKKGGNMPCILNAANEIVNCAFLEDRCGFIQMSDVIEKTMSTVSFDANPDYDVYVATDKEARRIASELLNI